jgi:hypothetical protein
MLLGQCVAHLAALELIAPQVDATRYQMHVEPHEYRTQLLIDAQVMMVTGRIGDETGHFVHERFDGDVIQEVFQGASV